MKIANHQFYIYLSFCIVTVLGAHDGAIQRRPLFDQRIVGGFQTSIAAYPHQVSLQRRGSHVCGGSIIGSKWILTASHCTHTYTASDFQVRVASSNQILGGKLVNVSKIIQHENFNRFTIDYDYALLELEHSLPSNNKKMKAINLPRQDEELTDNLKMTVSGWGLTKNEDESNRILRAAFVSYIESDLCDDAYKKFGGITEQMICAGNLGIGGKDSCQGDSGGPLIYNATLYGVVSWGFGCAEPTYPGVYAKVSVIRNWIREKTEI